MKTQSSPVYNALKRIILIVILLASVTLVLPPAPARADPDLWALQFDGVTDWLHLAPTADIIGSGWQTTKSVNLWVKPIPDVDGFTCESADAASCEVIFSDLPKWWGISIGLTNPTPPLVGQDRIWIWNQDLSENGEDRIGIPYTPGEWVNIALVHSGGILRAFKNGIERGSVASGPTVLLPDTNPELYLGGIIFNPRALLFSGQIDEVRIWNRALDATEIRANMFDHLTLPQTGLGAYYKMSNGLGTALTDDSGNGWTGTLLDGKPGIPPYLGDGIYPQWVPSSAFVIPDAPDAPTGLTATAVSAFRVNLSWSDNSVNETDFEIQRCAGSSCSDFGLLAFAPAGDGTGTRTHTDTTTSPTTVYCYRVRAINANPLPSAFTNVACATTWSVLYMPDVSKNAMP